jgi:hypothetical protein
MTADSWGWELRHALFGSIPVYEEKMPEAEGELELFRFIYLYKRTGSSGCGDKSGKRDLTHRSRRTGKTQRRPSRREEIRR